MRRLPLALADIEVIGTGGAPPIDRRGAVAWGIMAKLPERFARARPPSPVNAVRDGLSNTAGFNQKSREALCQRVSRQLQIVT